jgi:hypothetical protein
MRFCGSFIMSPSCKLAPHFKELSPQCRAAITAKMKGSGN